ncbi:MAG: NAD-dependent succinate-semialdehyde dehydrogenase [Pseudomonadota bacterium]
MDSQALNPANGQPTDEYEGHSLFEIEETLKNMESAFADWKRTEVSNRAKFILKLAKYLRENVEAHAILITTEMGKPIRQSRAEIEKCAVLCEYYAKQAEGFLQPEIITTGVQKNYVTYNPLGIILGIMPWNFPFWQVFRFAIPTLMAGNAVAVKHALNVTGCAYALEKIFHAAGFPKDLYRTFVIDHKQTAKLMEYHSIKAISFTGSVTAGARVAKKAGAMIKRTVLELGGSDPYIILEDADVEHAAKTCVASRLVNTGQSCVAAKRFIVVQQHEKQFTDMVVDLMRQAKYGDPMDESNDLGPLARFDLRKEFHNYVNSIASQGGKLVLGGKMPEGEGAFYPPTVLTNVKRKNPAAGNELFGPAAAIYKARDEDEAIAIANDSWYGLGAAVFTQDIERGERIAANEIQAGFCVVNGMVQSDPRLPFGGVKDSGYGRELSHFGLKEFTNVKTVVVR